MSKRKPKPSIDQFKVIWQQVLGTTTVQQVDNFIEAGGNSMSATMLVVRVSEEIGVQLSMREVFSLTYAELSQRISARLGKGGAGD
ncbi:acyl carrier protein [Bradyrhizobium sp. i1.4.4]